MVSTGLSKVGYEYINIDAGYLTHQRHPGTKKLVVNKEKFPSGIRKIADHVHSLGLKLGVYTDLTTSSCGAGPGSGGHYEIDAATFAHDWQAVRAGLQLPLSSSLPPLLCAVALLRLLQRRASCRRTT